MPVKLCCVDSCLSKDIAMFVFPRDKNLQYLWYLHVNPHSSELVHLSHTQLNTKKVCLRHFESQYLDGCKRKYHGFPTLFTEEEIATGIPHRQFVTVYSGDHDYCKKKESEEKTPPAAVQIQAVEVPECSNQHIQPVDTQDTNTVTNHKTRLVTKIQALTPKCRRLYFKCKSILKKRKLVMSDTDVQQNIANANSFSKTKNYKKLIENLDFFPRKFIELQLRFAGKTSKARRYNINEKLMSIALYKQSPKGYSLLQKLFSLPSKRTLNRVLQKIILDEGINKNLFAVLAEKIKQWPHAKKLCSIVFDEVQLSAQLNFLPSHDVIEGFTKTDGLPKFADHALVIMLRGICASWRQPVAYYFCQRTTPAATLKKILKDIVDVVVQCGLNPIAFICDQGATSQRALKDLVADTKRHCNENNLKFDGSIILNNKNISIIFDPPHLLKGLRNNMLTKNLEFEGKLTRWEDIVDVYNYDCKLGNIRMLPKLTDEHVIIEKIKKMKVKNCSQVFSERVAATMKYTSTFSKRQDGTEISPTAENTADAVAFFDRLFDSCNGSRSGRAPGKLRGPVKANSLHKTFWIEAIKKFKNMKFYPKNNLENATIKYVPTLKNWVTTLESLLRVSGILQSEGVRFYYTRNLNQDPLENFFGKIRSYNYRYNNPDTYTFKNSFKSLLMTDMLAIHSKNFNCEDDIGQTIINIKSLLNEKYFEKEQYHEQINKINLTTQGTSTNVVEERININARSYTAGYIVRKLCKNKCKYCKETFLTNDQQIGVYDLIKYRERRHLKGKNLKYPSTRLIVAFSKLVDITNIILNSACHKGNIIKTISNVFFNENNLDWLGCPNHNEDIKQKFILLGAKIQVFHWCRTINRILHGAHSNLNIHNLSLIQKLAYEKYMKQRKIKIYSVFYL